MDWLMPDLLRAIAVGVTIHLFVLQTWLARRGRTPSWWLALWAGIALVSAGARLVQVNASDPALALGAARVFGAAAPLQVWTLLCAVREIVRRPWRPAVSAAFAALNFAWAAAFVVTPWFLSGETRPVTEFGRAFIGGAPGPGMAVLGVYLVGCVAWGVQALLRSSIDRRERWVFSSSLLAYAVFGVLSVLSSIGAIGLPLLSDLATSVLAFGFSYVLIVRQHTLEQSMERLVEQRTRDVAAREKAFRDLVENAPLGIVACDRAGTVKLVNAHMWRILGAPAPLPLEALSNLLTHERMVRGGGAALARRALETGETTTSEVSFESLWNGMRTLRLIAAPLRAPAGEIEGALLLGEDVTERNAVQQHLRDSQKLEAMGRLAAGIAHEVNNPLACVRANLSVLREDLALLSDRALDAEAPLGFSSPLGEFSKILEESSEEVERAIAIVREMREFAHAGGASGDAFDTTSLNPLLRNCVRIAATQAKTCIEIDERYADLQPVRGAANQLRQVFLNLLVNAVQAVGEKGNVGVSTAREDGFVVVRISDDGPGISAELRGRLFQPFFTTKPLGQGTGLGLYISREIVQAHQGEIRVHSEPGAGSTFEVRLPIERR